EAAGGAFRLLQTARLLPRHQRRRHTVVRNGVEARVCARRGRPRRSFFNGQSAVLVRLGRRYLCRVRFPCGRWIEYGGLSAEPSLATRGHAAHVRARLRGRLMFTKFNLGLVLALAPGLIMGTFAVSFADGTDPPGVRFGLILLAIGAVAAMSWRVGA